MSRRFPSDAVPGDEKRRYTEAEVHSKLFEPDMAVLGYPSRTAGQADGEYFLEQRRLALRRLKSKRETGLFDLFEIRTTREEVRRFYRTVGRVDY